MSTKTVLGERKDKLIYREGDSVVKLFDYEYNTARVLNEAYNQARMEETGLNVPKLLEVKKIDGKWAIVYSYVEGKTLKTLMEENPDKEDEYLNKFVELQMWVHKQRSLLLTKLRDKMDRKIADTDLEDATKYELHTRLESIKQHNKVCHGDFNPSNIIIQPDGTPYIIDWSHVTQGNASLDVARSYLLFYLDGKNDLAEKYLDLFCEKSGTAKHYVQWCIPIVAASQMLKDKPEEKKFLLHWLNVVSYE